MAVIVQYEVTPPDPERFIATAKSYAPKTQKAGGRPIAIARLESNPSRFMVIEEWPSHEVMHQATEEHGGDFNREAGTEGLEWETKVWTIVS